MTAAGQVILDVRNLRKTFDQLDAVRDVSFQVYRGDVFALLGPNGAGKTTLANLLMGNLPPDGGTMTYRIRNQNVSRPHPADVGYFSGEASASMSQPILKMLYHAAYRRGMDDEEARATAESWLECLGLSHRAAAPLSTLSKGNQQKVQFAESVLHHPSVVFLDEPFSGLDPVNQELFIDMIRELQGRGMTIILSDHQMALVERLADQMCIINRGRVAAVGTLDQLRLQAGTGIRVRLRLADPYARIDLSLLEAHPGIRSVERTASGEMRLLTVANVNPVEVLNFAKMNLRISEIFSEPANLHDIYVQLVGDAEDAEAEGEAAAGGDWIEAPDKLSLAA